jgi:hypothetical protein
MSDASPKCGSSRLIIDRLIAGHRERRDAHAMAEPVHSRTSYSNATPLGVVFLEPRFRGVDIPEYLDVVGVADPLARIHVNEHGHLTIL